jgi:hypothetical protein
MPDSSNWAHKGKTPPEAFRRIRRGVDQIQYYRCNVIIGLVHMKVERRPVLWPQLLSLAHSSGAIRWGVLWRMSVGEAREMSRRPRCAMRTLQDRRPSTFICGSRGRTDGVHGTAYAHQGRWRVGLALRMFLAMMASSRTWKSNMPAQTKSAPFSYAYRKPSLGWIAPAAITL